MLYCYKGVTFSPPIIFETIYGEMTFMAALERELKERNQPWFFDGDSKALVEYLSKRDGAARE